MAFSEIQAERAKLSAALEQTTEKAHSDTLAQNARFEALQARATLAEQLLVETRHALVARADEVAAYDRRVAEATMARGAAEARLAEFERSVLDRDARIRELEDSRAALAGHGEALEKTLDARDLACKSLQHRLQTQDDLVKLLEHQLKSFRQASEVRIEELGAELQRERLERTMAEGALEAGRKDIARLLRELAAAQYRPPAVANDAVTQPAKVPSAA
jgi:chromosome segregation ATPase